MRRGFTLIESLVAIVLTGLGVAALVGAVGQLQRTEARALEIERMQRLAFDKFDEIVGTGDYTTLSGDFADRGLTETWESTLETTGVENLERLSVTVRLQSGEREVERTVYGLIYRPPTTTGTGGTP